MRTYLNLTPEQNQFLAHACAFIDSMPSQRELDQLLTLAAMLLPDPVTVMLAKCVSDARLGAHDPDSSLTRWRQ
ncbi:MAG: hypothetical protein A3G25_09620 [Betaproteobacteria bacterium RIFCSPLOWO2_12_FULL_63_13]|nr:MAG: hypothetical protein A3H32_05630 [Betaproteobacteria bacterium RIFCSPLOWO2_02_FULL_63_19]OGA53989.1 MAG: hypothetical protein A3G25_09620 [Betaproteobacteria bacterium RIFCSPLOWO2_12_FULL_63_13]